MYISKKPVNGFTPVYWATDGTITSTTPFSVMCRELEHLLRTGDLVVDLQTIDPNIVLTVSGSFTDENGNGLFYYCPDNETPEQYSDLAALTGRLLSAAEQIEKAFFAKREDTGRETLRNPHVIPATKIGPIPEKNDIALEQTGHELNELFLQTPFTTALYKSDDKTLRITENAVETGDSVKPQYSVMYRNGHNMTNLKFATIDETVHYLKYIL